MGMPRRDPEKVEQFYLHQHASPRGKRVLEVGCGDGRLTWLYAPEANYLIGADIELSKLRAAQSARAEGLSATVHFTAAQAEALPFVDESFDLVLFSWSLC